MTLTIDQRVSENHLWDAPIGTVITVSGSRYIKEPDGWHHTVNGGVIAPFGIGAATVVFVGTRTIDETLPQFQQRLRTVCVGRAVQSGVAMPPVHAALRHLNVPDFGLLPGMYVHWHDHDLKGRLPAGTLLMCGDPATWETLGVWTVVNDEWRHVFGPHVMVNQQALRVFEYPPGTTVEAWPEVEGDQRQLIAEFKVKAWDVGFAAKNNVSPRWCGDFENAMGRLDISPSVRERMERAGLTLTPPPANAATVQVGATLNADQQNALPQGAIVRFTRGDSWNWMYRTDTSTMPVRTMYLLGPNTGHWTASNELVWPGTGPLSVVVRSAEEMDAMPVGTQITEMGTTWTKGENQRWAQRGLTGSLATEFLLSDTFRYTYVPLPDGAHAGTPVN